MDTLSGGGGGIKSIPQLRKAFEHMQEVAKELVQGPIDKDTIRKFSQAWHAAFGKQIDADQAEAYLKNLKSMGVSPKSRTAKRRMRGGAAPLGAAPLDHQMGPGIYGVYGNFPAYVAGGFDVGVPRISQLEGWGRVDTTPQVPADIGSNRVSGGGGGRASGASRKGKSKTRKLRPKKVRGGSQWIMSTNPTSVVADGVAYWRGQGLPPSPSPLDQSSRLVI